MRKSKDLFNESQMSFGDHLEELRTHLVKALIGLALGVCLALLFGQSIVGFVRKPIDAALKREGLADYVTDDNIGQKNVFDSFQDWMWPPSAEDVKLDPKTGEPIKGAKKKIDLIGSDIKVQVDPRELAEILHQQDPDHYPKPSIEPSEKLVPLTIRASEFDLFKKKVLEQYRPITLNVQEGFMTYLKVSLVAGLVFSSPWVFYQTWLFVAVGLYDHERKYVYLYGAISLGLFLLGAAFCFKLVFPLVLSFLLKFTISLEVTPQIRLSEWISFAVLLPVMFGLSFQLPLVMMFLERLSIFERKTYRENRRMAILVIAVLSMFLTPAEPFSMVMMMVPLMLLYELGIVLCGLSPPASPFETEAST